MRIKPEANEYPPRAEQYVRLVPDGDVIEILAAQQEATSALLRALPEAKGGCRYAPGKWSLKEVIGHVIDVERMWGYRLLRIARNDARELPPYDRDVFVRYGLADTLSLGAIEEDYSAVRRSTITLIKTMPPEALLRQAEFDGLPLSARACAYIAAGHESHHINVLKDKYLTD